MPLSKEQLRQVKLFTDRGFDHVEAVYIIEAIQFSAEHPEYKKRFGIFGVGALKKVLRAGVPECVCLPDRPCVGFKCPEIMCYVIRDGKQSPYGLAMEKIGG